MLIGAECDLEAARDVERVATSKRQVAEGTRNAAVATLTLATRITGGTPLASACALGAIALAIIRPIR